MAKLINFVCSQSRLKREFIPQLVCDLKVRLPHDVSVDGPALAAHPIRAEILDEYHLSVVPAMLGGGKRVLNLLDERSFTNGMVYPTLA
jgi:dihydrofolate reductase